MAEYRIRDIQQLKEVILPIFDEYTLLTSKEFHYLLFREALLIYTDPSLCFEEKDQKLRALQSRKLPIGYQSTAWQSSDTILSKEWLVGFTEAEGSFYLVQKGHTRMEHVFEITQKLDKIVLLGIASILPMRVYTKSTYYSCRTTNIKSVGQVIEYFRNTMKGMKSLEYRI